MVGAYVKGLQGATLGSTGVAAVVGHDFGSPVAAWCSLIRPDVFRSVALMSSPFGGPPALAFATADAATLPDALAAILAEDLTMAEALARYASDLERLSPPIAAAYETLVARLKLAETGQHAPNAGDMMPDFILTD